MAVHARSHKFCWPWWWRASLYLLLFLFLSDNIIYLLYGYSWALNQPIEPQCLWSNTPGCRGSYEDENVCECVDSNTMRLSHGGIFGRKPCLKVLFIGCSYTFGVGVNDRDTFVWRLNELLPEVEADNGGVPGYGALRCGWRLRQLLQLKQYDLVVYPFLADHPQRDVAPALRRFDTDAFLMPYTVLTEDFRFIDHPTLAWQWWGDTLYAPINLLKNAKLAQLSQRIGEPPAAYIPVIYAHQVQAMAREAAQHGARFVMAQLDDCPPDRSAVPAALQMLGAGAKKANGSRIFQVWNVAFPEPIDEKYKVGHRPEHHPNAQVHAYWAEQLAGRLREYMSCVPSLGPKPQEHQRG